MLYFVICLLAFKILSSLVFINFPSNLFIADITKTDLVAILNQTRSSYGLQPLSENWRLDQAAEMKAEDMVQKQYFSHTSPRGLTPWYWFLQSGYKYKYAGENLAIGFYDSGEAFNAWLNSPSHRENMLNKNYKEVGTAVLTGFGTNNAIVVVQLFGSELLEQIPVQKYSNIEQKTEQALPPEIIENEQLSLDKSPMYDKIVLPESTIFNYLAPLNNSGNNDLRSRILNFIFYSYNVLVQQVIYGSLLIITGILLFILLFNVSVLDKKIAFRSLIMLILLAFAAFLNKNLLILAVSHQIII